MTLQIPRASTCSCDQISAPMRPVVNALLKPLVLWTIRDDLCSEGDAM